MDHSWFFYDPNDGDVITEQLSPGRVRIVRDLWEHDCLDVDVDAMTATHRHQGADQSGDPSNWATSNRRIRNQEGQWQMLIEPEDLAKWRRVADMLIAQRNQLAGSNTTVAGPIDLMHARIHLVEPGWISFASDISAEISRASPISMA